MSAASFNQRLEAVLDSLQHELRRLLELLQAEQEHLRERDADAIAGGARDKLDQVQKVERGSAALAALLAEKGLEPNRAGLGACLTSADLQRRWDDIAAHLNACAELNRVNGGVIEVSRSVAERLLGLLRGDANTGRLYGAGGKVQPSSAPLPIGKA